MATRNEKRNRFLRLHSHYEKRAYRKLRKEFKKILNAIKFDRLSGDERLDRTIVALNVNDESLQKAMRLVHLDIGNKYGKHVIRGLEDEKEKQDIPLLETKQDEPYPLFSQEFLKQIDDFYDKEGGEYITSLTDTMTEQVMTQIRKANEEGLTQDELIKRVKDEVGKSNFYRGQLLTIARTESSFAMNKANDVVSEVENIEIKKEWVHGGSAEPRADHLAMDGVKVNRNEMFVLPDGTRMKHPGDKNAPAGQVINCTCSQVINPVRDSNGDLIFR